MLDKARGYALNRPFYEVDENVQIAEGMVAFLGTDAAGLVVATTAASGDVPIGTFWKNRASSSIRSTVESGTFNANGIITLSKGNILATTTVKVTNAAGTTTFTQGVDYSTTLANGVVTRIAGGAITAGQTVIVSYRYQLTVGQEHWDNVSSRQSLGVNYDRQPDDTLGSSRITIVEGDAILYTDQYDVAQTYALNAALRSDANSLWSSVGAGANISSVCGRVVSIPTAADPYLGYAQIRVAV